MLAKMIRAWGAPVEGPEAPGPGSDSTEKKRRNWVIHPFLLGVFPIVSLYSHNVYELPLEVMLKPIGLSLGVIGTIWLILWGVTRDSRKSGLVTSLLVVLFFGFESFHFAFQLSYNYLKSFWVEHDVQIPSLIALAMESTLGIVGVVAIFRWIRRPEFWTTYLNAFTLILVALPAVSLISSRVRESGNAHRESVARSVGRQQGWTPDIYFIVLDGYARSDVMKDNYDYDNKPFLDGLRRRGFFVANQSNSNYCQTPLSLSSTLNLDYLDTMIEPGSHDLLPLKYLISHNRFVEQIRARGYKTISFATGFDPTENTEADLYLAPGEGRSAFNDILIDMTPLTLILDDSKWADRFSSSRKRTQFILDRLPSIARMPGPKFTFAHFLCPHPPFLFGENGEDVSPRSFGPGREMAVKKLDPFIGTPEYVRQGYRKQATYLTKRIERVIDQILSQSAEPPVIVLQSDHGAWLHYHPNDVDATELRERFGTLNAIYIPGKKYEGLTDQAVSVNTFRIVLNNVFGTKLPLLEARNYFSTLWEPLVLIDVTQRMRSDQERTRKFEPPKNYLGLIQQF
jgi:hypothetical protein